MRTAARTSSFQFKGKAGNLSEIGAKLHVDTLLEGSVRTQGVRMRVAVHLMRAKDGLRLWSATFDRELTDVFAVQEEIATAVSGALQVSLLPNWRKPRLPAAPRPEAHDRYLEGRYFRDRGTKDDLARAVVHFKQATMLDPEYAAAWAGLGDTISTQAGRGYIPIEDGYQTARMDIQKALKLDGNLTEALAAMGLIRMFHDWDWPGAQRCFDKALSLTPGDAGATRCAGSLARVLGQFDKGIALYQRAVQLDPLYSNSHKNFGLVLYYAGRMDDAADAFRKSLEFNPQISFTHAFLCQIELRESRLADALRDAEQEPDPAYHLASLAMAYEALGRREQADRATKELVTNFQADFPYQIAEVYAFRNDRRAALQWLQRAHQTHNDALTEIKGDPLLVSLREDETYRQIIRAVNLPQ
jgi:serine/threonine-protein kinase